MRKKRMHILMSAFLMLCVIMSQIAWAAPKWYEYYTEAQSASDKKQWERAIEFYLKAISDDPVSEKKKNYGMRYISYYPYLGLGMAYLATGKMEDALNYCQIAQTQGIEPKKPVSECVAIASKYVKATPQPTPTATPEPLREDVVPSLSLASPPPPQTEEKIVDFKGIASSTHGIKEIKVSVENLGTTTISRFEMTRQQDENFWIGVPLYFGQNTVTIEAIDMNDLTVSEQFSIVRSRSDEPIAAKTTAIPTVKQSRPTPPSIPRETPTPMPPAAEFEDTTIPIITLTTKIPAETDNQVLEISGVANDDGGMAFVRVSSGLADAKGLILSSAESQAENEQQTLMSFQQSVSLEPGTNYVKIEAIDVNGNVATREITIVRTADAPEIGSGSSETAILGQRYAVIIGIGAYQDERLNLSYTVNDAQGLYDVLTDPKYGAIPRENVQLLLSENATTVNIKKSIGTWLRRAAKEEDTVIIYYSGHGAPEGDETYWVTYDADIDDLYSTALSNRAISDMLGRISAKRLITFLDSCYSAATVNRSNQSRNIPTEIPWEKFTGEGRIVISASNGKELSLELDEYKHGIFTYYLLEGLKGQADRNEDAVIEVEEIWDFVRKQVRDKARSEGNNQTPVFQGNMTAGIALTMNMSAIQEKERRKTTEAQIQQLEQWFYAGELHEQHFDCAVRMLEAGKSNRALDALLKGTLSLQTFNRTFRCE